jgi:VIT1/CCC1 family predicted Fe2+/Mn2+ transporter
MSDPRWLSEMESAWLYRVVAGYEHHHRLKRAFMDLAVAAERQAATYLPAGAAAPPFTPSRRARLVAAIVKRVGPRRSRRLLAAMKVRGMSMYTAPSPGGHEMPTNADEIGARHRGSGSGTLRAAVFGVNDGLVSNTSLILGVAGAGVEARGVLLTGIAGLLAGAFSMAAGEYVSMRSQREMFEYQIEQEREELARYPEEEAAELALIYAARGVPEADARRVADALIADKEKALATLTREELGLDPDDLGSPSAAAFSSFAAFSGGALLPLAPFAVGAGRLALPVAVGLAAVGLTAVGATLSLFSGRGALAGGLRMLIIGAAAGGATYGIGQLVGVGL